MTATRSQIGTGAVETRSPRGYRVRQSSGPWVTAGLALAGAGIWLGSCGRALVPPSIPVSTVALASADLRLPLSVDGSAYSELICPSGPAVGASNALIHSAARVPGALIGGCRPCRTHGIRTDLASRSAEERCQSPFGSPR